MTKEITVTELSAALGKARSGEETAPRTRAAKLTDEEKAARLEEKNAKKAQRDADRLARQAAKAVKKPAHMAKVERAGSNLPGMTAETTEILNSLFNSQDASAISAFLANAQHRLRAQSTAASVGMKLEVGQMVRIVSGEPRFIGQTGTVSSVRRIRCHVTPEGHDKPVYLLNSDVVLVAQGLSTEVIEDDSEVSQAV